MSEIEIPADGLTGWQIAKEFPRPSHIADLCDLAVHLLAGWMRSEFHYEHDTDYHVCWDEDGVSVRCDERHQWTSEQWSDAARKRLEEGR